MRTLLLTISMALGIFLVSYNNPVFAADTKRVCIKQVDPKTKQLKQVCKDVKVHKKLKGTKVPNKKAK